MRLWLFLRAVQIEAYFDIWKYLCEYIQWFKIFYDTMLLLLRCTIIKCLCLQEQLAAIVNLEQEVRNYLLDSNSEANELK